ncbi:hypothetical protein ACIGCM_03565 [Pseudomonas sp. NPDC078700]|uniref:hypothetical protein n=1 Tax=Pseudomonas sp. NPDC078700 TaxID=3364424 RepID=UPI0037C504B9
MVDDLGAGAGGMREAGDGEGASLIGSPYCTYGGTANALTLTVNDQLGKPSAYVAGAQYRFRATAANTGAATVNVEGLGATPLVTVTGVALPAGYIRTDVDTVITYDAVGGRFVTGRELERGSNANGDFERFADGRLVCRFADTVARPVNNPFAGLFASSATFFNFPASFISVPITLLAPSIGAYFGWGGIEGNTSYTSRTPTLRALAPSSSAIGYLDYTAHGYWY